MNINKKINFQNMSGDRINLLSIDNLTVFELHDWSKDPKFFKHLEYNSFHNINQSKEYLIKLKERSNSITGHYWTISLTDNLNIGNVGVINISNNRKNAEITYGIHPDYWGKGYFKETINLLIKQLFEIHHFNRIWALTSINNKASINGLLSCGFKTEGILKQHYLHIKSNAYIDATILAMIFDDYNNK
jgi:[ribosomal protein S5]-alanine N-acetyltransferase